MICGSGNFQRYWGDFYLSVRGWTLECVFISASKDAAYSLAASGYGLDYIDFTDYICIDPK